MPYCAAAGPGGGQGAEWRGRGGWGLLYCAELCRALHLGAAGGEGGGDGAGDGSPFLGTALPPRPGADSRVEAGGPRRAALGRACGGSGHWVGAAGGGGAREARALRRGTRAPSVLPPAPAVPRAPGRAALLSELGSSDPLLGGGSRRYPTDEAAAAEDSHRGIAVQKVTGGSAAFRTSSSAPPFLLRFAGLRVSAAARPRASSVPRPLCGPALRPERGAG